MKKLYYGCEEFRSDCKKLADNVEEYNPEVIVAIARGGLSLAQYLGELLNIREVYSINSIGYNGEKKLESVKVYNTPLIEQGKRVLIVDDIADSGETLKEVIKKLKEKNPSCEYKSATIFYKKSSIFQPDFRLHEPKEWIEFFWSGD